MNLPTIIFDEIDTGVSGSIAEKMALMMQDMGKQNRQVISITHLPQIAAKGSVHYKVYKEDFLFDASNGDYDTWALLYIETPEGEKIELNEYWCEKDGKVYQITKEDYEDRKKNKVK